MNEPCRHARLDVISQDENGKFVECLDCHEIFESSELDESVQEPVHALEDREDLSDA